MIKIPFEHMSFAVIDDNAHIRRLLRSILHSFGCRDVYEAEDGAAGLEVVETHAPDIVIVDLVMPLFDGFDFVRTVRNPKGCKTPRVPIIMLTGHAEKRNVLEARNLGVTEFMCKPFSADTLYKRVQSIVEHPRDFVMSKDYYGPAWRDPSGKQIDSATAKKPKATQAADQVAEKIELDAFIEIEL